MAPAQPQVVALVASFGTLARAHGSAVLLPGGQALTAAHVVDEASLREELCRLGRWPGEAVPYLAGLALQPPGGAPLAATRQRLGRSNFEVSGCDLAYRGGADLALLQLEAPASLADPPPVCRADPPPGQPVLVVSAGRQVAATLGGEATEADAENGRYAVLDLRLEAGDSGGGVFALPELCLLGIVSMRDPQDPDRSWLVRAAVIRAFLQEE